MAKAKQPKTPESVATKKESDKSGTGQQTDEVSSEVNAMNQKQQDARGMPPVKFQKMQPSLAVKGSVTASVTPMSHQVNDVNGGIPKRGRSAIRRQYANVGNRVAVPAAADAQHLIPKGGFPMMRGRGRGRPRGCGSAGFAGIHRGMGVPAGPYGARDAASAHRGMPVRGQGRMHAVAHVDRHSMEMMLMRNVTSGSGDSQVTGGSVTNESNSAGVSRGECLSLCYVT